MAGIGFELRRLLRGDAGITERLQALLTATMITAGPWLVTMCTLAIVTLFGEAGGDAAAVNTFRMLVTDAFLASMVTVGALQMPFTRHVADLLHDHRYDRVLPAFVSASTGVALFQAATGLLFGWCVGLRGAPLPLFVALYVAVSLNWLAMTWLTVIRQHGRIFSAFVLGLLASVAIAHGLGRAGDVTVPLFAYAIGQGLTFLLLAALIVRGLEHGGERSADVWRSLRRYPALLAIGFCYGVGMWVDKIVFWIGDGVSIGPLLWAHPLYDTSCYLGYLTVLPALVLNLIVFETRFYERYRAYFAALLRGQPLREVEWQRQELAETLRQGTIFLLRWQGLVTVLVVVFAPVLLSLLGQPEGMVRTFRFACVGAFFQVFLLLAVLVLLYFDLRRDALRACAVFAVCSAGLSALSLPFGYPAYGLGYATAACASLGMAWRSLQRVLPELEYATLRRAAIGR